MASTLMRLESSGFLPVEVAKTPCVRSSVDNVEAHHLRIVDPCQTLEGSLNTYDKLTLSAITHKLYVSGYVAMNILYYYYLSSLKMGSYLLAVVPQLVTTRKLYYYYYYYYHYYHSVALVRQ
jgi:hypothetical protein